MANQMTGFKRTSSSKEKEKAVFSPVFLLCTDHILFTHSSIHGHLGQLNLVIGEMQAMRQLELGTELRRDEVWRPMSIS